MFSPGTRRVLLLQLALVTAAAAVLDSTNGSGAHKLTVGFQAPWNLSLPFSALRMGSALQLAMEKVNSNPSLLGNYSLDFVFLDTECDPKTSLGGFIHQVWKENVSALFGPACPEEAEVGILSPDLQLVFLHLNRNSTGFGPLSFHLHGN